MSRTIRGPLPASVYRRRRLAVLVALVTVVALPVGLVRLATGGEETPAVVLSGTSPGGTPTADAPEPGSSTLPSDDAADATGAAGDALDAGAPEGKAQGRKSRKEREPSLPEPQGSCVEEDVVVRPRVEDAVAGRPVTVLLTLRTELAEACTWELSRSTFTWKITSGDDEIWTSRECPRGVPSRELVVRRDTTTEAELVWGGRRSDADCSRLTDWALPGWYHATVSPLAGEPRDTQFELTAPAPGTEKTDPGPRRTKDRR